MNGPPAGNGPVSIRHVRSRLAPGTLRNLNTTFFYGVLLSLLSHSLSSSSLLSFIIFLSFLYLFCYHSLVSFFLPSFFLSSFLPYSTLSLFLSNSDSLFL